MAHRLPTDRPKPAAARRASQAELCELLRLYLEADAKGRRALRRLLRGTAGAAVGVRPVAPLLRPTTH